MSEERNIEIKVCKSYEELMKEISKLKQNGYKEATLDEMFKNKEELKEE